MQAGTDAVGRDATDDICLELNMETLNHDWLDLAIVFCDVS